MSPSTTERFVALVAALISSACRFGGPTGDPTLPVDGAAGAAGSGGQAGQAGQAGSGQAGDAGIGQAGRGGSSGASGGAGGSNPGGAAGAGVDASHDGAGHDVAEDTAPVADVDRDTAAIDVEAGGDGESDGDAAETAPPAACLPPSSSAVCDPVCNTGCPALFRCDITNTPRTGVCVGTLLSTANEGMACTRTAATDDCTERLSCIEAICRRLCYRDTDCTTTGTCCNTAIDLDGGASGYRACAPCMP